MIIKLQYYWIKKKKEKKVEGEHIILMQNCVLFKVPKLITFFSKFQSRCEWDREQVSENTLCIVRECPGFEVCRKIFSFKVQFCGCFFFYFLFLKSSSAMYRKLEDGEDGRTSWLVFSCMCGCNDTPAQSAPFVSFVEGKVHDVRCLESFIFFFFHTLHLLI